MSLIAIPHIGMEMHSIIFLFFQFMEDIHEKYNDNYKSLQLENDYQEKWIEACIDAINKGSQVVQELLRNVTTDDEDQSKTIETINDILTVFDKVEDFPEDGYALESLDVTESLCNDDDQQATDESAMAIEDRPCFSTSSGGDSSDGGIFAVTSAISMPHSNFEDNDLDISEPEESESIASTQLATNDERDASGRATDEAEESEMHMVAFDLVDEVLEVVIIPPPPQVNYIDLIQTQLRERSRQLNAFGPHSQNWSQTLRKWFLLSYQYLPLYPVCLQNKITFD